MLARNKHTCVNRIDELFCAYVDSARKIPSLFPTRKMRLFSRAASPRLLGHFRRLSASIVNASRRTHSVERWPPCTWDRSRDNFVLATQPRVPAVVGPAVRSAVKLWRPVIGKTHLVKASRDILSRRRELIAQCHWAVARTNSHLKELKNRWNNRVSSKAGVESINISRAA